MALSYPLSIATFADVLPIATMRFHLPEVVQISRTSGGEQLAADMGARLWQGTIELGKLTLGEQGRPEVLIDLVRSAGRSFYLYDVRRRAPLLDPQGSILGASTPTILAFGSDARELSLAGLPAGYTLSAGDYLSFDYGSAPVRRALHRVVPQTVVANGSGQTALFEVVPALRPTASTGAAVTLVKPSCKAVLVPGQTEAGIRRSGVWEGLRFDFVQTLGV